MSVDMAFRRALYGKLTAGGHSIPVSDGNHVPSSYLDGTGQANISFETYYLTPQHCSEYMHNTYDGTFRVMCYATTPAKRVELRRIVMDVLQPGRGPRKYQITGEAWEGGIFINYIRFTEESSIFTMKSGQPYAETSGIALDFNMKVTYDG